jgi:uncharacterized repeat protein (TIGR01451 family)
MNPRLTLAVRGGLALAALALSVHAPLFGQAPAQVQPCLALSQKMPEMIEPGSPLSIDLTVCNAGPCPVEGVIVTDQLPAGYDLLEAAPAAEHGQGTAVWRLGRLAPGEARSMRLRLGPRAPDAGPPQNVAEASFEARTRSVCVGQVRAPELTLRVVSPPATFVGQRAVWRMEIVNKGLAPARDVAVQTLLSEGLSHPMGSDLESNLGTLAPGETRLATLEATPTRPGDLQARVSVQARGARPATQTTVLHADPNPLTAAVAGPKVLQNGLTGLYELTVRNDGPTPVRDVVLAATVPQGMDFVHAGNGGAYDPTSRVVRWDLGELRPAEERVLAWNGSARSCGELESLVRLAVSARVVREQPWVTRVVSGEPASPGNITSRGVGN